MADIITITDGSDIPTPPPGESMGLEPRDFRAHPQGCYAGIPAAGERVFDIPLMSDQEIELAIKAQAEEGSSAQHVRDRGNFGERIPALDQNGQGYCWAYSTTSGIMLARAIAGLPYVRLSGHMIGCLVKGYRNQGGWNAQSVEFAQANGVASVEFWQEKSMSRSNDTPAMRENAKLHAIVEAMDLDEGGERLKRQCATCLLNNFVYPSDHNWWRHSVLATRLLSWNPFRVLIWNSWGNSWSEAGMGALDGSRAVPNGAIAIRVTRPKAA